MISHTQRFFNPPGLLPPLPFTNPLRGLSHNVEDPIHFDLNRNSLPTDRQLHDTKKLFFNKNNMNLPYMGKNTIMGGGRACYAPYPNMSPLCYKTSPERKDMATDRSPGLKSGMWPGMEHVGDYCAELLNRDKHYWTEEETGLMLELYEENKDYFNDHKTKKTKLWSVIADVINKRFNTNVNSEQCSQKYRNLKAEFLKISDPTSQDGGAKKYGRHFEQMKRLIAAEEKSVANRNSPTTSSGNNWASKNGSSTLSKADTDLSTQINNNNNNINNDTNSNSNGSSSGDLSPTDLRNTQLDIQLTQCPSPMRLEEPHLVNDMQVTSLTLTSPMTSSVSPTLLTTPDDMMTTKLSLPSDDDTSRRLDLETSSNEDIDCKFDPSPDGSENQCMMDVTGSVSLDQDMRAKNLCLLDNMNELNQAVHHALNGNSGNLISISNNNNGINNNNKNSNSLKDNSPCMDTEAASIDEGGRRGNELAFNMSSSTTATSSATTTTQNAVEILKLPLAALSYNPPLPSQQATSGQPLNNAITQSSNQNGGSTSTSQSHSKNAEENASSYGNELKDIFNDYFRSRNKELELYQNKEKQNIVCMNKCIDVFRKIMMEKIN